MDILNLVNDAMKESGSFENHPAKDLPLEERLLYLNGLSLIMNSDGDIHTEEKEYLRILIKSFDLDQSCLEDMVAFAQAPDKDTIQAFFHTFRRKPIAQLFLFDAYMLAFRDDTLDEKEKALIDQCAEYLEILKGYRKNIYDLFCFIKNKEWPRSCEFMAVSWLNISQFEHVYKYYGIDINDVEVNVMGEKELLLFDKINSGKKLNWIAIRYFNERLSGFSAFSSRIPGMDKISSKEVSEHFIDLSLTNGEVVSFLQSMQDKGKLVLDGCKVYSKINNQLKLLLVCSSISFDKMSRYFHISPDCEKEKNAGLELHFLELFYSELGLEVSIDCIPEALSFSNQNVLPLTIGDESLAGEIVRLPYGGFGRYSDGSSNSVEILAMNEVEVLTSGKIRLVRNIEAGNMSGDSVVNQSSSDKEPLENNDFILGFLGKGAWFNEN